MSDFKSKIGKNKGENAVGKFGLSTRNERGERLIKFEEGNKLYIMNTLFQKHEDEKWTWMSPDGLTKNEIDFFIINQTSIVRDVNIEGKIHIGSDHRAIKLTPRLIEQTEKSEKQHKQK